MPREPHLAGVDDDVERIAKPGLEAAQRRDARPTQPALRGVEQMNETALAAIDCRGHRPLDIGIHVGDGAGTSVGAANRNIEDLDRCPRRGGDGCRDLDLSAISGLGVEVTAGRGVADATARLLAANDDVGDRICSGMV